jgi:hypothetical protein
MTGQEFAIWSTRSTLEEKRGDGTGYNLNRRVEGATCGNHECHADVSTRWNRASARCIGGA